MQSKKQSRAPPHGLQHSVLTRTGPLQDIWFGPKCFSAESVAEQEATRGLTFKIKISPATWHVHRGQLPSSCVTVQIKTSSLHLEDVERKIKEVVICGGWVEL